MKSFDFEPSTIQHDFTLAAAYCSDVKKCLLAIVQSEWRFHIRSPIILRRKSLIELDPERLHILQRSKQDG
jgi:hypothetical protein